MKAVRNAKLRNIMSHGARYELRPVRRISVMCRAGYRRLDVNERGALYPATHLELQPFSRPSSSRASPPGADLRDAEAAQHIARGLFERGPRAAGE